MKIACLVVATLAISACSGPNEKAGKRQDEAAAAAAGEAYGGVGPNQRIGAAEDRAVAADQKVRDASADALKAQGREIERKADVDAARHDEAARAIRDAAAKQADALDEQARASRK